MTTKKIIGAVGLIAAFVAPASAQGINVTVDGDIVNFATQKPVQQFGNVLVPLRGVFERLGATVAYDASSKSILAVRGATTVQLVLGQSQAQVNGNPRTLAVPAQALNGTTLVPLRFVSESFGAQVKWQPVSRTVIITTGGADPVAGTPPQTTPPASGVEVTSLAHSATRVLRGEDIFTATLRGTPGGTASFTVPGIESAKSVPMRETAPGVYEGSLTIPKGITVKGASLLGSLKMGSASSPVIQAGNTITVDSVGPQFGSLSPEANASLPPGKPLLYGTYSDAGSGINAEGTHILVNGVDVTGQATVTDAFFSYRPSVDLPLAKNTVTVVAQDAAGNETRKEWAFTVAAVENMIKSVTITPELKTLEPGDVITIKALAPPGGKAKFTIGGTVENRPMQEDSPGIYTGSYTIKKGDSLSGAPATVTFTSASGQTVMKAAEQSVTIAAGAPETPTITSPVADAAVGATTSFTGKAAPGATIRYSLRYDGVLFVLPAGGAITDGEVKADAQGKWIVPDVTISTPRGITKVTYTFSAVSVGKASGELSEAATVQFHK